jgi:hypothetical protein
MPARRCRPEEHSAVDVMPWAPVASATVAVVGGAISIYGWVRTRGERAKAAEQAKIATQAAADASSALKQIAELHVKQDQRQQSRAAAEEREPWSIKPINAAQADLVNNSATPKYGINVKIYAGGDQPHHRFSDDNIPFVGPRRSRRITYIDINAEMTAIITWHLLEDLSDDQPPQTITW